MVETDHPELSIAQQCEIWNQQIFLTTNPKKHQKTLIWQFWKLFLGAQ